MNTIKKIVTSAVMLLSLFTVTAGEILNNLNTNWSIVVPGKVMVEPAATSYGFSVITDAKLLSTYSSSGRLLWETKVNRFRDAQIFVIEDDFILLSTDRNSKISLLNPSGIILWTKELDFQLTAKPLSGYDGRIFLQGNSNIECIGITSLTKWNLNTSPLSTVPLQTLPDGSIVAFLSRLEDGKTKGIRISPFGEVLEEILFAGQVCSAETHETGVCLTFTDGSAGFFSLVDNLSKNKWVLQNNGSSGSGSLLPQNSKFLVNSDSSKSDILFIQAFTNSINVYKVTPDNGQVNCTFSITNLDTINISKLVYNKEGLFICDQKNGFFYNDSGIELWSGQLPLKKGRDEWNFTIYTADNHFIICNTNWTLNSYRVSQATKKAFVSKKTQNYNQWYTIDTSDFEYLYRSSIDGDLVSEKRLADVSSGNYGKDEVTYISELLSACEVYKTTLTTTSISNHQGLSVFDLDSIATERLINQLTMYSSDTFSSYEAQFLQKITNKTLLNRLLQGIARFGYDPKGNILSALQILAKKTSYKDELILSGICDAVYSVCNFMGRPAFNSKGKEILSNFLYPNYSSNTRSYARETLKKISALDL